MVRSYSLAGALIVAHETQDLESYLSVRSDGHVQSRKTRLTNFEALRIISQRVSSYGAWRALSPEYVRYLAVSISLSC